MKIFRLLIVVLICATLFCSCESLIEKWFGKNEELSFTKTDYNGDQLRIDGYYYCKHEGYGSVSYDVIFFYKNGVLLSAYFSTSKGKLNEVEEKIFDNKFIENTQKSARYWGLFFIENNTIEYELLYYGPFRAYIHSGEILNDSTFVISKNKSSYGTDEKELQDTFRLKPFSPKPDSTNIFIK